jgi:hypothetical protein
MVVDSSSALEALHGAPGCAASGHVADRQAGHTGHMTQGTGKGTRDWRRMEENGEESVACERLQVNCERVNLSASEAHWSDDEGKDKTHKEISYRY